MDAAHPKLSIGIPSHAERANLVTESSPPVIAGVPLCPGLSTSQDGIDGRGGCPARAGINANP